MNIALPISDDTDNLGGGERPPCIRLTSDALPEDLKPILAESSHTGVSTRSAHSANALKSIRSMQTAESHWYALRVTYGREKKAYDYLVDNHVEAYYPTIKTIKEVDGKRKTFIESRLPNIFFARGTEEEMKRYVYDNVNLPYLRFYYCHSHDGARVIKKPLIIPDHQLEGLKILCASESEDILLVPSDIAKFKTGQTVRVIDGVFKGLIGKVARYQGQQRVAIIIDGLLTIASAYVPSAFLEEFS